MINLGPSLRAFLAADSGVSSLVGARIYPLKAPQRPTLPLLLWRWSYSVESDLASSKLASASLDCSVVAGDYDQAHGVATAVESALHGEMALTWGTASIRHILLDGREDDTAQIASDEVIFAVTSRFNVMFEELSA